LSPCDYALYDQDGDLEVTMKDFEMIFEHDEEQKHELVKRMFEELDANKGKYLTKLMHRLPK
jgi:Ca2+-binding EF-hand superfamily protein